MTVEYVETGFITAWMDSGASPRNPYVSGYGRKIPTPYFVHCADNRARRVYMMQYGNAGSPYIVRNGKELFLHGYHCPAADDLAQYPGWHIVTYENDITRFS